METHCCVVVAVGRTRQGHARFWCTAHQARAYQGAERLEQCVAAHIPPVSEREILRISPMDFPGGVAFWGAVQPVYDTTRCEVDFGIHVHARTEVNGQKLIDHTFKRVIFNDQAGNQHMINAEAAVYYMASLLFEKPMKVVRCSHCQASHLDKDWFSVHLHKKHLCAACGRDFFDTELGIGNPLMAVKEAYGDAEIFRKTVIPERDLQIRQEDYPGGIQIWGSNQAIVWTAPKEEEEGIHVHCYDDEGLIVVDDTFRSVTIDDIPIDPAMVRLYMAQSALPHLTGLVAALTCPNCKMKHIDTGDCAFTPHDPHVCEHCSASFSSPTKKKLLVSNPMPALFQSLVAFAPRMARQHTSSLRPEV